jgi:hypothetical protein
VKDEVYTGYKTEEEVEKLIPDIVVAKEKQDAEKAKLEAEAKAQTEVK